MRKVLCLGFLLMLTFSGFAQQNKTKVTDFRDISWGVHKDSVFRDGEKVNFAKVKDGIEENAYTIPNDDMTIGTVHFEKIQYIFNSDDRFKKVFLQAKKQYLPDMEFILNYKFGKPSNVQQLGYVTIKNWKLDNVVFTLSEFKNGRDIFTLTIESHWEQTMEYKKNTNVEDF